MKNKGFTLIELIAVVVIMGLIMLIVFPATSRLIRSNDNKKFDTYYEAVQEELELYARTRRDELGGIKGAGCVDDKKLSELKNYDYIKGYTEDKEVTCGSPADFSQDALGALGIDVSKQYINIRIDNNKGNIKVQYSMICIKNANDPNTMSLKYKHLIEKSENCENYVPVVTNSLINAVKNIPASNVGTTSYISNNSVNNYVWYSGKMWRILSYDTTERTIKLVSDDVVSIVSYDNKKDAQGHFNNNYSASNIFIWLKNVFLPTLRNTDKYLLDIEWNYSAVASNVSSPITGGNTVISKVGMLNAFEYNQISPILSTGKNYWLLSTTGTENAWYVNTSGTVTSSNVSEYYGVRPVIMLKPNVTYINGGNGSYQNPYRLTGDVGANIGTNLNTRFAGEYVSLNGITFRISSVDARYTKLVAQTTLNFDSTYINSIEHITPAEYNLGDSSIELHFFDKKYSDNTYIGEYLRKWISPVEDKLIEGDFCRMKMDKTISQTIECPPEDTLNSKVAIPKVGDMYALDTNKTYWTLNNSTDDKLYVVNNGIVVNDKAVTEKASILPIVVVNNTVTIAGGNGTQENPYILQ